MLKLLVGGERTLRWVTFKLTLVDRVTHDSGMGAAASSPRACTPEFVFSSFRRVCPPFASGTCVYRTARSCDSSISFPLVNIIENFVALNERCLDLSLDLNQRNAFHECRRLSFSPLVCCPCRETAHRID